MQSEQQLPTPAVRELAEVMHSSRSYEMALRAKLDSIKALRPICILAPMAGLAAAIVACASGGHVLDTRLWLPAASSFGALFSVAFIGLAGLACAHFAEETQREKLEALNAKRARAAGMTVARFNEIQAAENFANQEHQVLAKATSTPSESKTISRRL